MSWEDDLPPIPTERLRHQVVTDGRSRQRRRRQIQGGLSGALALVMAVTLVAVLPGDQPREDTVVASRGDGHATDSRSSDDGTFTTDEDTGDSTTSTTSATPSTTAPPRRSAPGTSTTLGPRQGEGAGRCPAVVGGKNRVLLARHTQDPPISHLYSVNPDGTCLQQHTFGTEHVLNWGASWSPDRDRIAFIRKDVGVMVKEVGRGDERLLLAETKVQPSAAWTAWSPDAKTIAAARQEGIWLIDVASGAARQLVSDGTRPSWSPTGDRIVFFVFRGGGAADIEVISPNGTGRTKIADGYFPEWGPDGRIAFQPRSDGIAIMNPDGTGVTKISTDSTLGFPVWSPDGRQIVASSGPGDTFVMNTDGSGRRPLTIGRSDTASDW